MQYAQSIEIETTALVFGPGSASWHAKMGSSSTKIGCMVLKVI